MMQFYFKKCSYSVQVSIQDVAQKPFSKSYSQAIKCEIVSLQYPLGEKVLLLSTRLYKIRFYVMCLIHFMYKRWNAEAADCCILFVFLTLGLFICLLLGEYLEILNVSHVSYLHVSLVSMLTGNKQRCSYIFHTLDGDIQSCYCNAVCLISLL